MLDRLYDWTVGIHVVLGAVGLVAFWAPVFAKKGGRVHRFAGTVFVRAAYGALAFAAIAVAYRLIWPFGAEGPAADLDPERRAEVASLVRGTRVFLGYLCVIVFASLAHGVRALRVKDDPGAMRSPVETLAAWGSLASGAAVLALGVFTDTPYRLLYLALGPLGVLGGRDMLRFDRNPRVTRMAWWYEHMGSMLGAGIAFHTAFAVFGAGRLFDLQAQQGIVGILPWVLPAMVGIPATYVWTRHYRRKFGEVEVARPRVSLGMRRIERKRGA